MGKTFEVKEHCPCHEFEERAAILEYDGQLEQHQAEKQATEIVCFGCIYAQKDLI